VRSVIAPTPDRPRPGSRLEFLDACRAFAVLGMLLANMMNVFLRRVPDVLSHNRGDTLRLLDFPAAVFQFLIGVSLVLFLEKRAARGLTPRIRLATALRRFGLLVALGALLDSIGRLTSWPQWGVLQTLGLGGLVTTGVAYLPDPPVAALGLALLALFSGAANGEVHASPLAALAFVPLTLAGLLVGRGLARSASRRGFARRAVLVGAGSLVLAAATRLAGVPFNKVLGSSSFVALAAAVSTLALLVLGQLEEAGMRYPPWLLAVGGNALMAWVLQYLLVFYPAWLLFPAWRRLPLPSGMVATLAALAALGGLTVTLGRRGIRIPI
jgi:predicted acyltransferase